MNRFASTIFIALLVGCASSLPAPEKTPFAEALLSRPEAPPEPPAPPLPDGTELPSPKEEGLASRILPVSGQRLAELTRIASDDRELAKLLTEPIDRDDLAALAFLRAPEVAAARERIRAARTGYTQSRDLSDLLSAYRSFLRDVETRVGPGAGGKSMAPWPGVLGLSGEMVDRTVAIAVEDLRRAGYGIVGEATRLHAEAAWLTEAISIREEDLRIEESLLETIRARLESGTASQVGYLSFANRLESLKTELAVLRERRPVVRAKLNRLLSRPEAAPMTLPRTFAAPEELPGPADAERVVAIALDRRPTVRKAELVAERAKIGVRLAETMTLPRFDASFRGASPRADFGVREAQVSEMRALSEAARSTLIGVRDRTETMTREALFKLDAARRRVENQEDESIPLAERGLESARGAFEGNRASWLDLLDAVRKNLDARLGLADARRARAGARADLVEVTGTNFNEKEQ